MLLHKKEVLINKKLGDETITGQIGR